jgi:CBS domain-containing protein
MSRELVRVEPDLTLEAAARVMASRRVGSVLVYDGERLAGILTERDILGAVAEGRLAASVGDEMTPHPETIAPEEDAQQAAVLMLHGGFRHLPVVDGPEVVGIVSMRDLVAASLADAAPRGV